MVPITSLSYSSRQLVVHSFARKSVYSTYDSYSYMIFCLLDASSWSSDFPLGQVWILAQPFNISWLMIKHWRRAIIWCFIITKVLYIFLPNNAVFSPVNEFTGISMPTPISSFPLWPSLSDSCAFCFSYYKFLAFAPTPVSYLLVVLTLYVLAFPLGPLLSPQAGHIFSPW
jgi:hypothetical protein